MLGARRAVALATVAPLMACAPTPSTAPATATTAAVSPALLDAGSYDRIWTDTEELLRRDTTKDRFIASLEEIHRTYGVSTHSALAGFGFEDRPGADGGTFLHMLYELDFPTGPARMQFTWRVTPSNVATLVAYQIERVTPTPTASLRG